MIKYFKYIFKGIDFNKLIKYFRLVVLVLIVLSLITSGVAKCARQSQSESLRLNNLDRKIRVENNLLKIDSANKVKEYVLITLDGYPELWTYVYGSYYNKIHNGLMISQGTIIYGGIEITDVDLRVKIVSLLALIK